MATERVSDRVWELTRHLGIEESVVIQRAVETLYRDMIISQYLGGDLAREEAVDELGADVVDAVDAARDAIEEDVAWGLHT